MREIMRGMRMLARFEVSGFKSLRDVAVDFGPFTCIAGPNGVGKSNLFDATRLLSAFSSASFSEAFSEIRAGDGQRGTVRSMLPSRCCPARVICGWRRSSLFLRRREPHEIEISANDADGVAPHLGVVRESLAPLRIESLLDPMRPLCAGYVVEVRRRWPRGDSCPSSQAPYGPWTASTRSVRSPPPVRACPLVSINGSSATGRRPMTRSTGPWSSSSWAMSVLSGFQAKRL